MVGPVLHPFVFFVCLWWLGVLVVAAVGCFRPRWRRFVPLLVLVGMGGMPITLFRPFDIIYGLPVEWVPDVAYSCGDSVALALALFYAARVRPWLAAVLVTGPLLLWWYSSIFTEAEWDEAGRPRWSFSSGNPTILLVLAFALAAAYSGIFVQRLLARRRNRPEN